MGPELQVVLNILQIINCKSITERKKSCPDSYQSFDLIDLASNQGISSFSKFSDDFNVQSGLRNTKMSMKCPTQILLKKC